MLWWPEVSDPQGLESQAIVSCLAWELNSDPRKEQLTSLTTGHLSRPKTQLPFKKSALTHLKLLSHFTT